MRSCCRYGSILFLSHTHALMYHISGSVLFLLLSSLKHRCQVSKQHCRVSLQSLNTPMSSLKAPSPRLDLDSPNPATKRDDQPNKCHLRNKINNGITCTHVPWAGYYYVRIALCLHSCTTGLVVFESQHKVVKPQNNTIESF